MNAAIAGIGATEFSKESGRSELQLAAECVAAAIDDAGLTPADVDGLVTFSLDTNDEVEVARCVGIPELGFFGRVPYGGGAACGTIAHAAMAVRTGAARTVVAYRAFNERSGRRYGLPPFARLAFDRWFSWYSPFGHVTPAMWVALQSMRYMHVYGVTNEHFAPVSVAARKHAAGNPAAWFYGKPITAADHQASRWIVEPVLRLLDCCQESDGGVAIVVTSEDAAKDSPHGPVRISAAAQGAVGPGEQMTAYYHDALTGLSEMGVVAQRLWRSAGIGPGDIDAAMLYDHFTPFVLMQLEELGFCGRGEAKDFVAGGAIEIGGRLPVNTNGGQLGEAYIHGMNGIAEGVRQIRGTAVNQVPDARHVLVTAGTGVPTSALVLSSG